MNEIDREATDNKCSSCNGEGGWFEHHGPGLDEPMGCPDCCATGFERPWEGVEALRAQLAALRDERDRLEQKLRAIKEHCAEEIREANVNNEEDNFDAGVVWVANDVLSLIERQLIESEEGQ